MQEKPQLWSVIWLLELTAYLEATKQPNNGFKAFFLMGFVALFSVILLLFSSLVLSSLGKLLDSLWPEPIAEFTLYPCSCRNKSEIWKGGSVWTTRTEQYNLIQTCCLKRFQCWLIWRHLESVVETAMTVLCYRSQNYGQQIKFLFN